MITVAVASYNHGPYVEECLSSIADQTYKDVELVWIDDCSYDGSFELVQSLTQRATLRKRFANIILRRNRHNRGAAFSLNLAARLGTGALISFMNSDDYYFKDRLALCMREYASQEYFFWFSNVMPVDAAGRSMVCDPVGERVAFDANVLLQRFRGVSRAMLYRQIGSSTGNFVVTRSLFNEVGGFVDLKYCHDWLFALQASRYCEPILCTERLYAYRLHASNSFRALGTVAEKETNIVLGKFFEAIALRKPENSRCPCPRRQPSGFWEVVQATNTREAAERVFFPYSKASRQLSAN